MLEESAAQDIVYSSLFTGVLGNYLKPSIKNAGLDPENLPDADKSSMNFGSGGNTDSKAWKDICLLYTSPSPRDGLLSRMPSSA